MLRVTVSQLKTPASYPPKMDLGRTVLGSATDAQQGLALSAAGKSHRLFSRSWTSYIRKQGGKVQKECLEHIALCLPQSCCKAWFWEEGLLRSASWMYFWSAVRRISLSALLRVGCAGWSPWPCISCLGLFPIFVLCQTRSCSLGEWFLHLSVHYCDIIHVYNSGPFCNRHCT